MDEDKKNCPFCGEEILAVARKCKHCGSELDEGLAARPKKPAADYGALLLMVPFIATMLIWFWVPQMNLLQRPDNVMTWLMLGTVLGTAGIASMEASQVGMVADRKLGIHSPIGWFFILALLWVIGYPFYLFKRKHYGLANSCVGGTIVMALFIISWFGVSTMIEEQRAKVLGGLEQMQYVR